jgi:hypothetical protein
MRKPEPHRLMANVGPALALPHRMVNQAAYVAIVPKA